MFGKRHQTFESLSHHILSHILAVRTHRFKVWNGVTYIYHCGGLPTKTLHVHEPFLLTYVTWTTRHDSLRFESTHI